MSIPINLVEKLKLIEELPCQRQEELAQKMKERRYKRREVILKKDEQSKYLYFLIEGRLQGVDFTVDGREAGLFFVNENDYFGELSIIDGIGHTEYIISTSESRVATLPAEEARHIFFNEPAAAKCLARSLAHRIRHESSQRSILRLPTVAQRLCAQILQITTTLDRKLHIVKNIPTQQELAIMIDTSRETVTRTLQSIQNEGAIERRGKDLVILRRDLLQDIMTGKTDLTKGRQP